MSTIELASKLAFFKKQNEDLYIDEDTKLIKKDYMISYVDSLMKEKRSFGAYLCNIDDFTVVNEFYGNEIANSLLEEVARKLESIVGNKGIIAKCAGDEYLIVLDGVSDYNDFWTVGREITIQISKELFSSLGDSYITVTLGGARFPEDGQNSNDLMLCLNKALYRGKIKGKNCFIIYLADKHANIVIKKRERLNTSVDITAKIFDIMTNPNIKTAINDTFHFLLTYYQFDHIGIETESGVYFSHYSMKYDIDSFKYIDVNKFHKAVNGSGVFKYSDRRELTKTGFDDILAELENQHEESMIVLELDYLENNYGALIVDMKKPRVWQPDEIALLLTIARILAILLNKNNTTIDRLTSM